MRIKNLIMSRKGSLTVQFLFGFVLILSFVMLFAVMTLTLAVSGVTQYITYAASRTLSLGHISKGDQEQAARKKYKELMDKPSFSKLFKPGLFEVRRSGDLQPGNGLGLNTKFSVAGNVPNLFYGVWTKFVPKILEVDTLWGGTEEDAAFFETAIGSYLGREPTSEECQSFIQKRWDFIIRRHGNMNVQPAGNPAGSYQRVVEKKYKVSEVDTEC